MKRNSVQQLAGRLCRNVLMKQGQSAVVTIVVLISSVALSYGDTVADEAAIRAVLADFDAKAVAHDVSGCMAHVSTNLLHAGSTYDDVTDTLAENLPTVEAFEFAISSVDVQGESATVYGTVNITQDGEPFSWVEPDHEGHGVGLGFLKKEEGVWKIYGNQSRVYWFGVSAGNNLSGGNSFLRIAVESPFTIQSASVSGPYISPTDLTPDNYYGGVRGYATPSQRPSPGTEYTIEIVFSDGARETITDTIGAWVETAPELTVTTINGTTTFSWNDITADVPNAEHYMLFIQQSHGVDWRLDIPISQTSVVFNSDGSATGTLQPGQIYTAQIFIFNATGDYAYRFHEFTLDTEFRVTISRTTSSTCTVNWEAVPGQLYDVRWTDNLTNAFQTIQAGIEHPQNSYTDTVHSAESSGFYRIDVRLLPLP